MAASLVVNSGARVLVETFTLGTVFGSLLRLTPDSVYVADVAGVEGSRIAIERPNVARFSVSAGRSSRRKPVIAGALIGAVTFQLLHVGEKVQGCVDYDDFGNLVCPPRQSSFWGELGGVVLGGAIGGGIGYGIGGQERWRAIAMPLSTTSRSGAGGGVVMNVRF